MAPRILRSSRDRPRDDSKERTPIVDAVLDDGFLAIPYTDDDSRARIDKFVGFLGLIITERAACKVHLSNNWFNHYAVQDRPLQFTSGNREVAELLQRLLAKCETFTGDLVEGLCAHRRPNPKLSLLLTLEDSDERAIICGADAASAVPCGNATTYQVFWRRVLQETNLNSRSFDDLVKQAFWGIVVHPEASDRWDRMGHVLTDIREKLVTHLSYLSDECARDFRSFAKIPSQLIAQAGSNHVDMSPKIQAI